jgi:hypothetical protein
VPSTLTRGLFIMKCDTGREIESAPAELPYIIVYGFVKNRRDIGNREKRELY